MIVKIISTTPSRIDVTVDGRELSLHGESFIQGMGSPDFVIYKSSVKNWRNSNSDVILSESMKDEIIKVVIDELTEQGWKIEVE